MPLNTNHTELNQTKGSHHTEFQKTASLKDLLNNVPLYRQNQIDSLEKVQRRGIHFITGDYNREDSVTATRLDIPGLPIL